MDFIKKNKIKFILLVLIIGAFSFQSVFSKNDTVPFFPIKVSEYGQDIHCEITHSGGIYGGFDSLEPKNEVKLSETVKQSAPIKFTFKINEDKDVKILIGDSVGVSESNGFVVLDKGNKINIVNTWGLDEDNLQNFTLFKDTGFFLWTRSGDMLLLGSSLAYGFGRCL